MRLKARVVLPTDRLIDISYICKLIIDEGDEVSVISEEVIKILQCKDEVFVKKDEKWCYLKVEFQFDDGPISETVKFLVIEDCLNDIEEPNASNRNTRLAGRLAGDWAEKLKIFTDEV